MVCQDQIEKRRLLNYAKGYAEAHLIHKEAGRLPLQSDGSSIVVGEINCKTRYFAPIYYDSKWHKADDLKFLSLPGFIRYMESVYTGHLHVRFYKEAGYLFCFFPTPHRISGHTLVYFVCKSNGLESLFFNQR